MAEWSNATDLRSVLFGGAGSNPARGTFKTSYSNITSIIITGSQVRVLPSPSGGVAQSVEHVNRKKKMSDTTRSHSSVG